MAKEKQVQIPEKLYEAMIYYILLDKRDKENYDFIYQGVMDKIDRQHAREYYSKYKCDPSPEEREKARQAYLDHVGIHPDWRWGKETDDERISDVCGNIQKTRTGAEG
jgi:hypothetical protein